jgi:hypothetical protein
MHIRDNEEGEAQHRKYKRLKLGRREYNCWSDSTAVVIGAIFHRA